MEGCITEGMTNTAIALEIFGRTSMESTVRRYKKNRASLEEDMPVVKEVKHSRSTTVLETVEVPYQAKVFNNKKDVYKIETVKSVPSGVTQLMIPDTQCKSDTDLSHLDWLGAYIVDKKPEVIVHIGDHADMESLSSYDKGKGSAEGKRVQKDIESAIEGMNRMLKPLYELQQDELEKQGEILYKPKMVITLGNHEERIVRHVNSNPELQGFLSYDNLMYKEMGWEVGDFLEPITINGVTYCHYMPNPMSGRPYGGAALNVLKQVGESFCMGHQQKLDIATRFLPASGRQQWAIIAGAYYQHDEGYKSYQGNKHFRGIVVKHQVKDGSFNPQFIDIAYMKQRYGK